MNLTGIRINLCQLYLINDQQHMRQYQKEITIQEEQFGAFVYYDPSYLHETLGHLPQPAKHLINLGRGLDPEEFRLNQLQMERHTAEHKLIHFKEVSMENDYQNETKNYIKVYLNKSIDEIIISQKYRGLPEYNLELQFKEKLDITYSDGVLYVDCNGKTFVINRQTPNLQLWYSSPVSGPQRYNYIEGDWRNQKNQILQQFLIDEIKHIL
ncbi:hypothetical protein pb186bvf_013816 [Paramecium bursaria]